MEKDLSVPDALRHGLLNLQSRFGRQALEQALTELEPPKASTEDDGFIIEPYDDHHVLVTSKETGAQNIIPNAPMPFEPVYITR